MSEAYILKNQFDLFLDKHGEWVDQAEPSSLYRTVHKDEAINIMVEHSVKNPDLRIKIETCELNAKGQLVLADGVTAPAIDQVAPVIDQAAPAIDQSESHLFAEADKKDTPEAQIEQPASLS